MTLIGLSLSGRSFSHQHDRGLFSSPNALEEVTNCIVLLGRNGYRALGEAEYW